MSATSWVLTISIIVLALIGAVVSAILAYKAAKKQAIDKIQSNHKLTKSLILSDN